MRTSPRQSRFQWVCRVKKTRSEERAFSGATFEGYQRTPIITGTSAALYPGGRLLLGV
jgi:hypothetical protein